MDFQQFSSMKFGSNVWVSSESATHYCTSMSSSSWLSYGMARKKAHKHVSSDDKDPHDDCVGPGPSKSSPQTPCEWLTYEKKVCCFRWCFEYNNCGTWTRIQEWLFLTHPGSIIYRRMSDFDEIFWSSNLACFIWYFFGNNTQ